MHFISQLLLAIVNSVLMLLTIGLFAAGFAEKQSGYSIAGAIMVGCAMIALAIYYRPGGSE